MTSPRRCLSSGSPAWSLATQWSMTGGELAAGAPRWRRRPGGAGVHPRARPADRRADALRQYSVDVLRTSAPSTSSHPSTAWHEGAFQYPERLVVPLQWPPVATQRVTRGPPITAVSLGIVRLRHAAIQRDPLRLGLARLSCPMQDARIRSTRSQSLLLLTSASAGHSLSILE